MKKLTIKSKTCEALFSDIGPICGDIRVQGWIHAPSKDIGFAFSAQIGQAMGRKSIGGFCWDEVGPVDFPFGWDEPKKLNQFWNMETNEEAIARIEKMIRRVKRLFATGYFLTRDCQ